MNSDDYRRLVAANLTPEQIAVVMEMMDREARLHAEAEEARKAKGRDRVAKWREARNVTETQPKVTVPLTGGDARVEVKTSNSKIEPKEENKSAQSARVSDLEQFCSALAPSVDAERIESYVKHRKSKRGQITGHAARLFLADAAACSMSPSEAVDACISRNWITVKPEYFAGRSRAPPKPEAPHDVGTRLLAEMRSANGQSGTSDSRNHQALVAIPGGRS